MSQNELVCGHTAKKLDQALIKKFRLSESGLIAAAGSSAFRTISAESLKPVTTFDNDATHMINATSLNLKISNRY